MTFAHGWRGRTFLLGGVVPLLTGAAPARWRPSHSGASNTSHATHWIAPAQRHITSKRTGTEERCKLGCQTRTVGRALSERDPTAEAPRGAGG